MGEPALLELPYFDEEEMARLLCKAVPTLRSDRCRGRNHPPTRKLGRLVVYPKRDFWKWWEAQPLEREILGGGREQVASGSRGPLGAGHR